MSSFSNVGNICTYTMLKSSGEEKSKNMGWGTRPGDLGTVKEDRFQVMREIQGD